nr:hypothetical transcript [Hymenolepis microstoma]
MCRPTTHHPKKPDVTAPPKLPQQENSVINNDDKAQQCSRINKGDIIPSTSVFISAITTFSLQNPQIASTQYAMRLRRAMGKRQNI